MNRPHHQQRQAATFGDALRQADPSLAQQLESFARGGGDAGERRRRGSKNRRPDARHDPRGERRHDPRPMRPVHATPPAVRSIDPNNPQAVELSRRSYVEQARVREVRRRLAFCDRRRRDLAREDQVRVRRGLPADVLGPLGRLVILTDTDVPSALNVVVAWPGDRAGLICAYLDSDLYNEFGWWYEPTGGGAIDLFDFGVKLDVFPRAGAWQYRTSFNGGRSAIVRRPKTGEDLKWSPLDVGTLVLHIRYKTDIEEGRKAAPKADELPAKPEALA